MVVTFRQFENGKIKQRLQISGGNELFGALFFVKALHFKGSLLSHRGQGEGGGGSPSRGASEGGRGGGLQSGVRYFMS